jgi:5-methylcytosine-specific restriction endonuclease McrA
MKKKVKKKSPTKLKQIENRKQLKAWSVRCRAAGACAICGTDKYLNAHHILQKEVYPELKFVDENAICLCVNHHKFGKYSAHRNGIWFTQWLQTNQPTQFNWAIANA